MINRSEGTVHIELERDEAFALAVVLQAWRDATNRDPRLWDNVGDEYVARRNTAHKCGAAHAKLMRELMPPGMRATGSESKPPGDVE
jgi:hypothetical protein